ncbi:MAG: response regulator transcription factor [Anaerolineae bacterium]
MARERSKIRVVLVEDQLSIAETYQAFLEAAPEIEFVGHAINGPDGLELIARELPDVALVDLVLEHSEYNGVELIRKVKERGLPTKLVVITSYIGTSIAGQAIQAGADGLLGRSPSMRDIIMAVQLVHHGLMVLGPREDFGDWFSGFLIQSERMECPLTERQLEVLKWAARGCTNQEIGRQLHISEGTVRAHFSNMQDKLGVSGRQELIRLAIENGWIERPR